MANLNRKAKSGCDWNFYDLKAYNISIVRQDAATFFGQGALPPPLHHPDLLNGLTANEMVDEESYQVARYMDLAMQQIPDEESAVDDFTMLLLRVMGYAGRGLDRDLRSRKNIPLLVCGEWRNAEADVCVMDMSGYLLLVQEDKGHMNSDAQLIAQAIAAAESNNETRSHFPNMARLDSKVMAGITMTGTSPIFFKIPVTSELIKAVRNGQYPATPTIVAMHRPEVPRLGTFIEEGMLPLDNRRCILACFEAFKQFVC